MAIDHGYSDLNGTLGEELGSPQPSVEDMPLVEYPF